MRTWSGVRRSDYSSAGENHEFGVDFGLKVLSFGSVNAPSAKPIRSLDPVEWDFRAIRPEEFSAAWVYEYARSCPWVTALWTNWLGSTIPTYKELDLGLEEPALVRGGHQQVVREVLRGQYPLGIPIDPTRWDLTAERLSWSFPSLLRQIGLDQVLLRVPAFPTPWFRLKPKERQPVLQMALPAAERPAFRDDVLDEFPDEASLYPQFSFAVTIDFTQSVQEIEAQFSRWLRFKRAALRAKGLVPGRMENAGRAAGPRYEVLTWLGAYRFTAAGVSFKDARAEVQNPKKSCALPPGSFPSLPLYKTAQGWSRHAGKAKRFMTQLFLPSDPHFNPPASVKLKLLR